MPSAWRQRRRRGAPSFPSPNHSTESGWGQLSELTSAYSHWLWKEDLTPRLNRRFNVIVSVRVIMWQKEPLLEESWGVFWGWRSLIAWIHRLHTYLCPDSSWQAKNRTDGQNHKGELPTSCKSYYKTGEECRHCLKEHSDFVTNSFINFGDVTERTVLEINIRIMNTRTFLLILVDCLFASVWGNQFTSRILLRNVPSKYHGAALMLTPTGCLGSGKSNPSFTTSHAGPLHALPGFWEQKDARGTIKTQKEFSFRITSEGWALPPGITSWHILWPHFHFKRIRSTRQSSTHTQVLTLWGGC